MSRRAAFLLLSLLLSLFVAPPRSTGAQESEALRIHPENSRYFLFRGKPLVLLAASEHYGSVINRRFDYARYLRDAAEKRMTMTRTFLLFRELQSARNPSSPAKPESPDYLAPFARTGPGKALDGEPAYDLDRWNPEYFQRLESFLALASELGIVVELTLLSNTYGDTVWALNPLRAANNKQGIGKVEWPEYTSLKERALVERQVALARKIVQETSRHDNIYYEVCNEPGGGVPGHVSPAEVDAWQEEVAKAVRDELAKLGRKRLIAGQEAFTYSPKFAFGLDKTVQGTLFDIANVHPLPNTILGGRAYELGNFMSKELMLAEMAAFSSAATATGKPVVHDEDNAASLYTDASGWTIHRKRAWAAVISGCHYDFIDFSITAGSEAGTAASAKAIRTWMRHLSELIHAFDFIHARPALGFVVRKPAPLVAAALAIEGEDYVAYLADAREVTDPAAGEPIAGEVVLALPAGSYAVSLYSPVSGGSSPALKVEGGQGVSLELLPFRHDVVIRAQRVR